jgi:hypothetical protein
VKKGYKLKLERVVGRKPPIRKAAKIRRAEKKDDPISAQETFAYNRMKDEPEAPRYKTMNMKRMRTSRGV